jgi:uncharacterized protein
MTNTTIEPMEPGECRIQAALYVVLVFGLSLFLYIPLFLGGTPVAERPVLAATLMWIPAVAAGGTLGIRRKRFRPETRFRRGSGNDHRRGSWRLRLRGVVVTTTARAIFFPTVTGLIAYGVTWATGLAEFTPPAGTVAPAAGLLWAVLRAALLGGVLGIPMVAGEELGWRAFLAPRLAGSGVTRPVLMGGIVWAAWHAPLILTGRYAAGPIPLVAVMAFGILAVSLHSLWTRWYFRTGSLWPALFGHAAWNAVIQFPLDGHTSGNHSQLWVGDSGVIVALVCAVLTGIIIGRDRAATGKTYELRT